MTLQYRAILCDNDKTLERPLQIFATSLKEAEDWANTVLVNALEGAAVVVYQTTEVQIKLIPKKRAE